MPPTPAIASIPVGTIEPTPDDQPDPARRAAYRRLAVTILGLDVPTLVAELQAAARPSHARQLASAQPCAAPPELRRPADLVAGPHSPSPTAATVPMGAVRARR